MCKSKKNLSTPYTGKVDFKVQKTTKVKFSKIVQSTFKEMVMELSFYNPEYDKREHCISILGTSFSC